MKKKAGNTLKLTRFRFAQGGDFFRGSLHVDVKVRRALLLGNDGHPLDRGVERVRL